MHEYDTVLKALLQSPQNSILETITGARIDQWLNVEFPEVQQTRVDMLGLTLNRQRLIGIELQSTNDVKLPLRMAEYALRTFRLHEMFPEQYVLYVGDEEMRMPSQLSGPNFVCRYTVVDIRTLDEEALLASPFANDNILAFLTKHRDRRKTIQRILQRIATLEGGRRDDALKKLMILAGLRKLGDSIRTEAKHMPILDDIMDHDVIGPAIREGLQQGRQEEVLKILRGQISKRFGAPPAWVEDRLANSPIAALEDLSLRLLDVPSIDELFNP